MIPSYARIDCRYLKMRSILHTDIEISSRYVSEKAKCRSVYAGFFKEYIGTGAISLH
jgi:hypothetical protein